MRLADFQNPLANTLHVQNQQQASQQLQQGLPTSLARELERQDIQEDTTVQETEEESAIQPIREDEERGFKRHRRMPSRRAAPNNGRPPVPSEFDPSEKPKDGIHGIYLDVEA